MNQPSTQIDHPVAEQAQSPGSLATAAGRATAALLVIIFVILAAPIIQTDDARGRAAYDANNYHEIAIRSFQSQWPTPDLSDYPSATTPGYHLGLSLFALGVSDDRIALRWVGALFTVGLLITLGVWTGRRLGTLQATLCCLPLVVCLYVYVAGAYLLPDNAGWWGVLAIVLLSLSNKWSPALLIISGVILVALVFTRQVHLWAAAPIWVAAWLGPASVGHRTPEHMYLADPGPASIRLAGSVLVTLPAFLLVASLVVLWGGLVPPGFQEGAGNQQAGNPAAPAFILALLGGYSIFFVGFLFPVLRHLAKRTPAFLIAAAILGALLAVIPATSYSEEAGRFSGYWSIIKIGPTFADRSLLLIIGSALGGISIFVWWAALPHRHRWVILVTLVAFIAAQSANTFAWQRYHEPMILMLLPIMAACTRLGGPDTRPWSEALHTQRSRDVVRLAGPALLTIVLAAITLQTMLGASEARSLQDEVEQDTNALVPPPVSESPVPVPNTSTAPRWLTTPS